MMRLLLIDDEPALILDQMNHLFVPRGAEIVTAGTGIEGLREFEASQPDVVLLDMSLPALSGMQVYEQLREADARVPVIFITAMTGAAMAIEATRKGAYDYLFKP